MIRTRISAGPDSRIFQFDGQFFSAIQPVDPEITCTLYPNPVSNQLHIQLSDAPVSGLRIEIGNLHDQKMHLLLDQDTPLPEQSFDFDLSGLQAGIYLVKIQTANALELKTVVKM